VKSGDWNVICVVRDKKKMERQAKALGFPEGSYTVKECDLKSLTAVRKLRDDLQKPSLLG
jgi:short-subunit dehydrogenase